MAYAKKQSAGKGLPSLYEFDDWARPPSIDKFQMVRYDVAKETELLSHELLCRSIGISPKHDPASATPSLLAASSSGRNASSHHNRDHEAANHRHSCTGEQHRKREWIRMPDGTFVVKSIEEIAAVAGLKHTDPVACMKMPVRQEMQTSVPKACGDDVFNSVGWLCCTS